VVARLWRGWSTPADAASYEEHLRTATFPELAALEGQEGAYLLRRDDGGEVEFVVVTLWRSLEAIDAFAGPDREAAVVPPEARRVLTRYERRVTHFDVRQTFSP
jgi:heme-degrading monooxygenase HmoA